MADGVPFFDLGANERRLRERLHASLDEVLAGGYFVGGPIVERFEARFAGYVGAGFCAGVGNGLDAIRLIFEAYGIGEGDEVIVPAFTYYASWLGVMQTGARIVPVDVEFDTANLDATLVEAAVTSRTRAILAVHLFGRPARVEALRPIADQHSLLLIEDAAQAHGAETPLGMVGSVGHAAAFSFYPTKNLGALGDAGAITTSDERIDRRIRSRRSYGQGSAKYDHVDTGWNSRLDPLQASFLEVHLDHLQEWTEVRRAIGRRYADALGAASAAVIGAADLEGSVWHHIVVRAARRDDFRAHMLARGVHTDVHYPYAIGDVAPARARMADGLGAREFPVASCLARMVVSLPVGPWMTEAQVAQVVDALASVPAELLGD